VSSCSSHAGKGEPASSNHVPNTHPSGPGIPAPSTATESGTQSAAAPPASTGSAIHQNSNDAVDSALTLGPHAATEYNLHEQMPRHLTPGQFQEPELSELVLIAQDLWHVINRVLVKIPKKHPHIGLLKAHLKQVFAQVSRKAQVLKASSVQELLQKIERAAVQLSRDLTELVQYWSVPRNREELQQGHIRELRQVFDEEIRAGDFGHAELMLEPSTSVPEELSLASKFRERNPADVSTAETMPSQKVRPMTTCPRRVLHNSFVLVEWSK
jgi:hypothetical protein